MNGAPLDLSGLADIVINANEGDTGGLFEDEVEEDEEEDRGIEENPLNNLKTISKLKTTRRKRFPWSESLDRYFGFYFPE